MRRSILMVHVYTKVRDFHLPATVKLTLIRRVYFSRAWVTLLRPNQLNFSKFQAWKNYTQVKR